MLSRAFFLRFLPNFLGTSTSESRHKMCHHEFATPTRPVLKISQTAQAAGAKTAATSLLQKNSSRQTLGKVRLNINTITCLATTPHSSLLPEIRLLGGSKSENCQIKSR